MEASYAFRVYGLSAAPTPYKCIMRIIGLHRLILDDVQLLLGAGNLQPVTNTEASNRGQNCAPTMV